MQKVLLFPFILFVVGCTTDVISKKPLAVVDKMNDLGYREVFQQEKGSGMKQGKYQKYASDGVLIEEAFFVSDTLDGARILYYPSGDTLLIETYRMGSFHGVFKAFYESGGLELVGAYVDNAMAGEWRKYYKSGNLMEVVTFADNEENGPFTEYYENGNLKASGNYLNGDREHGLLFLYDEEGVLIRKMDCDQGLCKTIWKTEE